jgi:pimeloyl-ACP methyl ester carboxylesterase
MPVVMGPDSRKLAFEVLGDPAGVPVVVLHGTPGSWRQLAALGPPARYRGLAVIAPDRAGYGGSSDDRARTIASGARDVAAVIAHLGVRRCGVVGLSGGGPTALACATLPGELVSAVATVGGVAPLVPRDRSLPPDRLITRLARRSQFCARVVFELTVRAGRARPDAALDRFASLLAEPDARLLKHDVDVRRAFLDDLRHPSKTTARAAARDFWLFTRPWDVDFADMRTPIHIWHGTEDRNVPVAHAYVLAARCPTARLHIVDAGGHILFDQLDQILAGVIGR